ncbi:universal stress protein [uncultured Olleya sp.]|uniref:universal stress protein n=1 Tax=uncultured Olleya sp. TaxID=757243 RepID=UPI0025930681|nr:universal stress protein [uncultured Olleya sp.]
MNSILVAVGSSQNAQSHLQYAVDFAEQFEAKLYIVQIYNVYTMSGSMTKVDEILERDSLDFLNELVSKLDTKNVDIEVKALKGKLIKTLNDVCSNLNIDLLLVEPRTNSDKDDVYLGKTSGKIIKQTNIPAIIVPENYVFEPIHSVLFALKSTVIQKVDALKPLINVKEHFNASLNLLLVKTSFNKTEDFVVNNQLDSLIDHKVETENATTYQGVLEHHQAVNPDLLCVVRRKRGFFNKMWEKNSILKRDFYIASFPVLVLSGLK